MTATLPGYQAALERLFGLERGGGKLGLEGTRLLLSELGNPERRFASLHIAGTNGKGSTACYLERLLREMGYVTGLFTSPHLVDFRERIRIGGVAVSPAEVSEGVEIVSSLKASQDRTFFEAVTALGFRLFAERGVEAAVVEVGLGGRLDSTNVIEPSLCGITPVGLDHTDLLGGTVAEVAGEKAGIVKAGVPVVVAPQSAPARQVIERAAREKGAPLVAAARRAKIRSVRPTPEGTEVSLESRDFGSLQFRLRALGRHQANNAAMAVALLGVALERGLRPPSGETIPARTASRQGIENALARARWPGRLERSSRERRVWWDGAHNPHGARVLRRAWSEAMADAPAAVVLGCSSDKDVNGFLRALAGPWTHAFAAAPQNPRAFDPAELARRAAARWNLSATCRGSVAEAVADALDTVGQAGRVLVTGSLFTVGEAMAAVGDPPPEALP